MRTRLTALAVAALMTSACAAPAVAQQSQLLGTRVVADRTETDVIQVPGGQHYGAVRLCVAQRSVHFKDIDIHFGNGGSQDASVRALIGPGECTRWINLNGPRRDISRITMRYEMIIDAGAQAVVTAYGR